MTFVKLDEWAEKVAADPSIVPEEPVFLIGLTGPIGCGKSTVGTMLGRLGGRIINADHINRAVLAPDQPVLYQIMERFGPGVFLQEGGLNRSAIANLVFHDPVALRDLEAMTHPLIRLRIQQALDQAAYDGVPFAVLEAIKLIESEELSARCDEIWLIDCHPAVQRERIILRGFGDSDMDERMAIQHGIRERARAKADRIIMSDGPLAETKAKVEEALAEALAGKLDILPLRKPKT